MLKILVVDDSRSVHAFIKRILGNVPGVSLDHVSNGSEAMAVLVKDHAYDLVMLDWEMPEMNGPETLTAIRKLGGMPVLMMSTKNEPEDIGQMLEFGATDYMMKPFTLDILLEKIELATGKAVSHAA